MRFPLPGLFLQFKEREYVKFRWPVGSQCDKIEGEMLWIWGMDYGTHKQGNAHRRAVSVRQGIDTPRVHRIRQK